ncbi:MAG: cation transporter [Bdellovibrionaceae bacterium]|nr:cation transporter [Bdellovibrio sp.]
MSSAKKSLMAALLSLIVSVVVLTLKTKAYYATHSVAVLSDALETVVNVITSLIALYAVKLAAEPADENHPYGHGKMEYFSAAFEGGMIFFAALSILFQAIRSFFETNAIHDFERGFIFLGAATLLNLVTGLFLISSGKANRSEALKASGKHIMSDVMTTLGVGVGLLLVKLTGIMWIDSIVGLLLGLWLGYEAYKILRANSGALLDETDDVALFQLAKIMSSFRKPGVVDIHNVRMIRSGNFHHIDAHMVVPYFWDVEKGHSLAHEFEKNVVRDYDCDGEFAFHMDPCQRLYCKVCALPECPVRKYPFEGERPFTREHLVKGPEYTP